jgi:hypothetical protein
LTCATFGALATASLLTYAVPVRAQQTPTACAPDTRTAEETACTDDPASSDPAGPTGATHTPRDEAQIETADKPSRLFGVLPNSSTIEAGVRFGPVTTSQAFRFATEESFDKFVFPFVGVVAYFGVGQPQEEYWKRYVTAFADNAIGNYMVTAVFPTVFHQDPRYFQLGTGSIWRRIGYSASRAVVTRSRDGHDQFNLSEIGGNALGAMLSNAYYAAPERSAANTLARAGSQIMWDTVSFEAKEFWPDIRRMLQQMFHGH